MKRIMGALLSLTMIASLAACQKNSTKDAAASKPATTTTTTTEKHPGDDMSLDELVKAAQKEAKAENAGEFMVYAPTSRLEKAMKAFTEAYGIKGEVYHESGQDLYTKLTTELEAKAATADVALLQDAYLFQTQMRNYNYVINYVPKDLKDKIKADEQNPLVCYYYNKLFIYNNQDGAKGVSNIWQLTEPEYKGKIFIKDLSKESVNKNFLAMLTKPENAEKLQAAYKEYYKKDIKLDEDCKNAGYQFIKAFLPNVSYGTGDGDIATDLSNGNGNNYGLIVFSKLRDDSVNQEKLTVSALSEQAIQPLSGFMYPMYMQIISSTDRPYTARLFINFMMSKEGFEAAFHTKAKDIGTYSGNSTIESLKGDKNLDFWKEKLIVEDPEYLQQAYASGVLDFITMAAAYQK
ncbi:ABC transporter substrate-binding protein [Amygdalobacter nucleatus]|uniref:ABC transporter substrate-binding protein n=1 Tax=Amygdalobacter nucleatus TaxID=3029274 RepID=UPI0027A352B4|nr:ABC transporter substrate-binding protein [Amygdalobacter nucleatus]WEG36964.1 ABC transporter substrate-binding protein [Amygdalobacter nucleatus]